MNPAGIVRMWFYTTNEIFSNEGNVKHARKSKMV